MFNIQIRPLDNENNLLSRGKTVLRENENLSDKVAYAAKRAGKRTNVIEVTDVTTNETKLFRPDGTPINPASPKRLPKGVTYANLNGLPTNVGLIEAIGKMIDMAPADTGWTGQEIAERLLSIYPDRSATGIVTTIRCQISRGNLGIVKKFQDGNRIRYARHVK
jgi:hypothetical protein